MTCCIDVAILYQIIKAAEQDPIVNTLPFRAIFAAYEAVLAENGLDSGHDQIYLRFLFRLGKRRDAGQTLYETFEALLEELGFQIEFVPDEDGVHGVTKKELEPEDAPEAARPSLREARGHARRSRRNSFTSLYDAEDENTGAIATRPRSRASESHVDVTQRSVLEPRPSTRATTRKTEKTAIAYSPFKSRQLQTRRDRLTAEEFAKGLQYLQPQTTIERDITPSKQPPASFGEPVAINRSLVSRLNQDEVQNDARRHFASQHGSVYNPSKLQLSRDAEAYYHYRIRSVAQEIISQWCNAALQKKDQHEHLQRLAAAHDTEILLRQAFEHWRLRLHTRKQAAATARYFQHEERRVEKARDLMLMSKAFTHWMQCASEERLRTIDAREKILSKKYFQAWQSITLANQINVRHQRLRRFLGIWKKRYVGSLTNGVKAELAYYETTARRAYWQWFWAFCERRAPEWRAGRLRRKYLSQWLTSCTASARKTQYVTVQFDNALQRQALTTWLEKARFSISSQRKAVALNHNRAAAHALKSWRRSCVHGPLYQQVSNMVDWRVAGVTFANFVAKYRYENQAKRVNRLRMLRNAWTQWNDRLRWQTVVRRTDDRYCLEALYRWVVSERSLLLERLSDERLKQRFLAKLRSKCHEVQSRHRKSLRLVGNIRVKDLLQNSLRHWTSRMESYHGDERIAFEFHAPKIAGDAVRLWVQRLTKLKSQDGLAGDAYFFFFTRRFLKCWHVKCLESKKQKRKDAYVQVRRRQKMQLARGVIRKWMDASAQYHYIEQQAVFTYQNHLLALGTELFDHWKDQFGIREDQEYQASEHYERRLLERHLYTWIERLENQSRREELADLNCDMRVKNVAFSWFNRSRLRIIELKGQEANAENLRHWYEKRHFRGHLRQWQDAAAEKLKPKGKEAPQSRSGQAGKRALEDEGATSRAEDWTEFDIGDWIPALEAQSSSTPLPGYLSTPSKRAARAKALVRVSTTPSGTPFAQRLRSQIGSAPRSGRRAGLGRSTAMKSSIFGAIPEDSPRTPVVESEG